jgi:TRAP-type C4-dicarboxylate transport system permease large subunit
VPGRLSLLAVGSGTLLASLSGASIGTTAMLGATLAPEMERRGYHKSMSLGPLLGSGGLAIMIPPSGLGVILAVLAKVSVGKLLIAIVLPGLSWRYCIPATLSSDAGSIDRLRRTIQSMQCQCANGWSCRPSTFCRSV